MPDHGLTWGVLPADTFERVLVFSPHFDDAAMGAGHLLLAHPGSTVCTVFAGPPERYPDEPTEWDALGGFQTGDDVVAVRREEDLAALAVLGAEHHWLDFVDHQYLEPDDRADRRRRRARARRDRSTRSRRPRSCCRSGIANPDHVVDPRRRRCRSRSERPDLAWFAYEDAGYKHIPGMLAWRVVEALPLRPLAHADDRADACRTTRASAPRSSATRRSSGHCARDHALDARIDGAVAEQFWQLAPPPPGWERMRDASWTTLLVQVFLERVARSTCCSRTCPSWSGRRARTSRS